MKKLEAAPVERVLNSLIVLSFAVHTSVLISSTYLFPNLMPRFFFLSIFLYHFVMTAVSTYGVIKTNDKKEKILVLYSLFLFLSWVPHFLESIMSVHLTSIKEYYSNYFLIPAVLGFLCATLLLVWWRNSIVHPVIRFVFISALIALGYSASFALNLFFVSASETVVTAGVVEKARGVTIVPTYKLYLSSPPKEMGTLIVPQNLYNMVSKSESVELQVRTGYFDIEWVEKVSISKK